MALNNLQRLICYKLNQPTNQPTNDGNRYAMNLSERIINVCVQSSVWSYKSRIF